jgi:uncharacterized protein YndB with AHSA1/START domain
MVDVDGFRHFDVTPDVLWSVVADPASLSAWVPTIRQAELAGPEGGKEEEVHVADQSPGSELHIHVSVPDRHAHTSADVAELREGLDEALDRLAALLPE